MRLRSAGPPALLAWALALPVAALDDVPRPALDAFEPAAAEHLEEARDAFDRALETATTPAQRASAFGDLGMIYYGYELHDLARVAWGHAVELAPEDGRWLYLLGLLTRIEGDWAEADTLLARAVAADPTNLAARIHWGRLLLETGEIGRAEEQFRAVRAAQPTSAAAALGLARAALAAGRPAEAIEWGRRTLALEPAADVAHHHIGLAYRALGDGERARRHLALSRHRDVSIPDPLTDDLADLVRGAAIQAKHGVEAAKAGRQELAVRYFSRAAEIAPDSPSHLYNLGVALREAGQPARATATLRRLTERFPDHRDGHFNLAALLAQTGDIEGAARHYAQALEIDPGDRVARIEWAGAISHLGQLDRAQRELEGLVAAEPDDAEGRLALATLLLQRERPEEAATVLAAGLERDVTDREWAALAHLRGEAALASGRTDAARREFERALARAPEFVPSRLELGRLLARLGQYTEATRHFRRLVEVEPSNLDFQLSLALALRFAGARDELLAALEAATDSLPNSIELHHLLAQELVSCAESPPRDAERGLALARRVMEAEPSVEHAETVAAALAAGGDFDSAASWQRRVVDELRRAGDTAGAQRSTLRLMSYRDARRCPPERGAS